MRRRLPIYRPKESFRARIFSIDFALNELFIIPRQNSVAASVAAAICEEPSISIILTNLRNAVITGIDLAVIIEVIVTRAHRDATFLLNHEWSAFFIRWLHVLSGVM